MYEHLIERFGDEANLPSTGWCASEGWHTGRSAG